MMAVVVVLPGPLAREAGTSRIRVGAAGTVASVLDALFAAHPALRDRILTEPGQIRQHVNVFVGSRNVRATGGLATPVPDGAEVFVLPAVSGG